MNQSNCNHFILTTIILLSTTLLAYAQKKEFKAKYGKISGEEIKMTAYKGDPEAAAVVLFDIGNVYYNYNENLGWVQIQERHKRIKIFKKEAYEYANISLPLFGDEKLDALKGVTYNLEGDKLVETKLNDENIFTEQLTKRVSVKKFNMPAVKEGSIIEFKYTIRDENAFFLPEWTFQDLIPTQWSEYEASVPEAISYRKMSFGNIPFVINESKNDAGTFTVTLKERSEGMVTSTSFENAKVRYNKNVMHFAQANIPALKLEKYTTSPRDHLSRIIFEINAVYKVSYNYIGSEYVMNNTIPQTNTFTWEAIAKEMYEDIFEKWVEQDKYLEETVINNAKSKETQKEKVAVVADYFDKNFQSGDYNSIFPSQSLKEFVNKHKGTPTDINLLFISYLKKVGLNAAPVMISTQKHGTIISFYPNYFAFDKVITCVSIDDKETFVDASMLKLPIGLMPMEDTNDKGLYIQDNKTFKWVNLENKFQHRFATHCNLKIEKDGLLNGAITVSSSGYIADKYRTIYKNGKEETLYKEILKEMAEDATLTNKKIENIDNFQEPNIKMSFDIKTPSFVNVGENKIYLSPVLAFVNNEHRFKDTERHFDVHLPYLSEQISNYTYNIPDGYKIESAPKSAKISFGDNGIIFEYILDNSNENQIKLNIKYKEKATLFSVEEYKGLRDFYNQIIAKISEQVVLAKI